MRNYSFSKLTVRGFPTILELNHPYIYGGVQVMINVSEKEYPKEILDIIETRGIRWYHFPLKENTPDIGIQNILAAVRELMIADANQEKTVLHCAYGNNRSRTVAECFHYKKMGFQLVDEYKGYPNHLAYNCGEGYLPPIGEVEKILMETIV